MANGRVTIRITADAMAALATVVAGDPAGAVELDAALRTAGVVFGVDPGACERLASALADPDFSVRDEQLATGQPAREGESGTFEPAFHAGIQPGKVREDGSMDFRDRELLKPVTAGELVGRIHPAVRGTPGRRVDGKELPVAAVREVRLRLGPGIAAAIDGTVSAGRSGVVLYSPDSSLDVVDHHLHGADVDVRSGHLVMEGTLVVRGDVQRLFSVRASGDVEIRGSVESGSVYAGGDVSIKARVHGGDTGIVSADGNLSAHHAERARLACGGLLKLEEAVACELSAERIQVTRCLRGGTAVAERSIVTYEAGSLHGGADTTLVAGVPLERPLFEAQGALDIAKEQRMLELRADASGRGGARAKGGKLGRAHTELKRAEIERMVARAQRRELLLSTAHVHVLGVAHSGVAVCIGDARLLLDQPIQGVRFSLDAETRLVRTERPTR